MGGGRERVGRREMEREAKEMEREVESEKMGFGWRWGEGVDRRGVWE